MARFKVDFSERLAAAKRAKDEALARFKAHSGEDNSAVIERGPPTVKARAKRTVERSAGPAGKEREAVEKKTRERDVVSGSGTGGARGGRGSRRSGQ